jgi:MtN3 and saliva related transmembrane protein
MNNFNIEVLGLVSGALTTIAFIPQVWKTYKSRSAKNLSLGMFMIFCTGTIGWLAYGIFRNDLPVMAANALTLALCLVIIYFKFRFKEQ